MSVVAWHQFDGWLRGAAVVGANPGWYGSIVADTPFAALALVQANGEMWWAKAGVASTLPLALCLHPCNYEHTFVQFLFSLGTSGVHEVCGHIAPEQFVAPTPSLVRMSAGQATMFWQAPCAPPIVFALFILARSDVSIGRKGIWRPHQRLRSVFPKSLDVALFGTRRGRGPNVSED